MPRNAYKCLQTLPHGVHTALAMHRLLVPLVSLSRRRPRFRETARAETHPVASATPAEGIRHSRTLLSVSLSVSLSHAQDSDISIDYAEVMRVVAQDRKRRAEEEVTSGSSRCKEAKRADEKEATSAPGDPGQSRDADNCHPENVASPFKAQVQCRTRSKLRKRHSSFFFGRQITVRVKHCLVYVWVYCYSIGHWNRHCCVCVTHGYVL